jgi:hypothetical protein
MEKLKKTKGAITYYAEDGLKDVVCCLCGEKIPEYEFRGRRICSHCIDYIRARG